ncbi:helix-turn-helix domain-containing protein [Aeromicrobium sp. 9AM]|uniref:helix-turn-helix domain-containing protein n=1 Tax=Aeromicrobium sp. 9AM TaxID=2653126 RepID=UPI0012F0AB4B|nr:helix-turn-helix domain-containing protein [Aeromicrobium sp. 9AM]VXB62103.1 DNA-binding transcriptional regulator, IclR family [Aeromicrobium sp. 9AM]
MTGSSPPTRRVVDVVELLAEHAGTAIRLSDIVKALNLNQATAFAIMKELVDAGWVTRDPARKTFSIGGGLTSVAMKIGSSPSVRLAAESALRTAATETGYAGSVAERSGEELLITTFVEASDPAQGQWHPAVGERLPFAAPFGPAFAAWDPEEARGAWIERCGVVDEGFRGQLAQLLEDTLAQGYSVERTSPEMVSAIPIMVRLQAAAISDSVRADLDKVLVEIANGPASESGSGQRHYVGAITAPVFGPAGHVTHNISLHPFTALSAQMIDQLGRRLRSAADTISGSRSA